MHAWLAEQELISPTTQHTSIVINEKVYEFRNRSVVCENVVVLATKELILDYTVCRDMLIVICKDSKLYTLNLTNSNTFQLLVGAPYKDTNDWTTSKRQYLSSSFSSAHILLKTSMSHFMLFKVSKKIKFIRTFTVTQKGAVFQLQNGHASTDFFIWSLRKTRSPDRCLMLDVYLVNSEVPEVSAHDASEQPKLSIPVGSAELKRGEVCLVDSLVTGECLLKLGSAIHLITYKHLAIGDVNPLLQPVISDAKQLQIKYLRHGLQVLILRSNNEIYHSIANGQGFTPFTLLFRLDREASGAITIVNDEDIRPQSCGGLTNFQLDVRKRPWRVLAMRGVQLVAVSIAKHSLLTKLERFNVPWDTQLVVSRTLSTLFITSKQTTAFFSQFNYKFGGLKPQLMTAEKVGHSVVFVYPHEIEVYSAMDTELTSPIQKISLETILECVISMEDVVVRHLDRTDWYAFNEYTLKMYKSTRPAQFMLVNPNSAQLFINCEKSGGEPIVFEYEIEGVKFTSYSGSNKVVVCAENKSNEFKFDSAMYFGGQLANGIIVYSHGIYYLTSDAVYTIRDYKSRPLSARVISCTTIENKFIVYVYKQQLRVADASQFHINWAPLVLRPEAKFMDKFNPKIDPDYRFCLLVPSQRVMVCGYRNFLSIFDSFTFQQLNVSGLTVSDVAVASLWQFQLNNKQFEHIVLSDGMGTISSYSLNRVDESHVEAKVRFRFKAFPMNSRLDEEQISCSNSKIAISHGPTVAVIDPFDERATRRVQYSDATIKQIALFEECLVVISDGITVLKFENEALLFRNCEVTGRCGIGQYYQVNSNNGDKTRILVFLLVVNHQLEVLELDTGTFKLNSEVLTPESRTNGFIHPLDVHEQVKCVSAVNLPISTDCVVFLVEFMAGGCSLFRYTTRASETHSFEAIA